jgi:hypothetical protein
MSKHSVDVWLRLEKLTVVYLLKKLPTFYQIRKFITVLTRRYIK